MNTNSRRGHIYENKTKGQIINLRIYLKIEKSMYPENFGGNA